jgi:predicted lipid-binding transport protein (Tim44 family)
MSEFMSCLRESVGSPSDRDQTHHSIFYPFLFFLYLFSTEISEDELDNQYGNAAATKNKRQKRGPPLRKLSAAPTDAPPPLVQAARAKGTSPPPAIEQWAVRYVKDRAAGTAELLTFLLSSAGLTGVSITSQDVEHVSADNLRLMVEDEAKRGLEDVLSGRTNASRHARITHAELWAEVIVRLSEPSADRYCMDHIINVIVALSTSAVREFRRVATWTANQISFSLLRAVSVSKDLYGETAEAEAEAEAQLQSKPSKSKSKTPKTSVFAKQAANARILISDFENYVDVLFSSVYANRFRDVDSEVRSIVVEGLGRWMVLHPATYLTPEYLKYLAWALSDRDAAVRFAAATGLRVLYEDEANATQLSDFTTRFVDRFRELMEDKDDGVAVEGVRLVALLHPDANDGARAFRLLSDSTSPLNLRKAAAELAVSIIQSSAVSMDGFRKTKAKKPRHPPATASSSELQGLLTALRTLAATMYVSDDSDDWNDAPPLPMRIIALVIGALEDVGTLQCLEDWALMVDWLVSDVAATTHGDAGVVDLIHCMFAALSSSTTLPSVQKEKQKVAALNKARRSATIALQPHLTTLFKKYQTDPECLTALVTLIPVLDMSVYTLKKQERALIHLLSLVKDAFATQSLAAPTAACAAALAHAAHVARGTVKEDATTLLEDAAKDVAEELDKTLGRVDVEMDTDLNKDSPRVFALSAAVCRAAALAQVHPSAVVKEGNGGRTVGDCMSRILDIAATPQGLALFGTGVVVLAAAKTMLLGAMMSLSKARIAQSKRSGDEDNTDDGNEAVAQLAAEQAVLGSQLQGILLSPDPPQGDAKSAKLGGALVLADFLTIFAPQTLPSTLLHVAAYKPSVPVINAFWSVMEGEILSGDVEKVIKAVETVARLCCGPFDSDGLHELGGMLASKLLSHWTSPPFVLDKTNGQDDGDEYAEATNPVAPEVMNSAIKETLKWAKSNTGNSLPGIYLNALIEAYDRSKRQVAAALASQSITQDDANDDAVALGPLLDLSQRLAGSHAGLNVPASVVAHVARDGAIWAIRGGPERIDFLQGVSFFMIKLKGSAAVQVLEAIEEVGASCIDATTLQAENVREEEGEWDLYFQYCDALRAAASRPIGGAARGGVRQGREKRISFGENLGNQENQENEEDAGDDIMPTEEELPPVNEDDEEDDEDVPRVAARKRRGRRS